MKPYFLVILFLSIFYRLHPQVSTIGLVGYWPFHGNALDSSGNANNGNVVNAQLTTDRFGNCNEAYQFNGINSRILVPNSPSIDMNNTTDFSVSLWLKVKNNNGIPLSKNNYGSWSGYVIFANTSNSGYCNSPGHVSFYTASGAGQDACSNNAIDTNWHHIAGVYKYSNNKSVIYVDGVLQTDIGQRSGGLSSYSDLIFGDNMAFNEPFRGYLDAIRIYKRELISSEVLQLFNEGSPANTLSFSNLVRDTTVCTSPLILNAGSAASYTWSTGSNSQTISVNSTGLYWVTIQSSTGCRFTDSAHIVIVETSEYDVITDTILCTNSGVVLDASPSNSIDYHWSTGEVTPSVLAVFDTIYWVDMHIGNCEVRDSAQVTIISPPFLNLVNDTVLCRDPIILNVLDTTVNVTWWNGSHSHHILVDASGTFYISGVKNGCEYTDTAVVVGNGHDFNNFIPNVITPNGDGINDFFEIEFSDLEVRKFFMYNRWGQLIYSSSTPHVKWDGKQNGSLVNDGTYFWTIVFENNCDKSEVKKKGFITVFK